MFEIKSDTDQPRVSTRTVVRTTLAVSVVVLLVGGAVMFGGRGLEESHPIAVQNNVMTASGVLTQHGKPVITVGASVPVTPRTPNMINVWVTANKKIVEANMHPAILRFFSMTDNPEHPMVTLKHPLKAITVHARSDLLSDAPQGSQRTPANIIKHIQARQMSAVQSYMSVAVEDVLRGCTYAREGRNEFEVDMHHQIGKTSFHVLSDIRVTVRLGCGSPHGELYAEFMTTKSPYLHSVLCRDQSTPLARCPVHVILTTKNLVTNVEEYAKVHGDGVIPAGAPLSPELFTAVDWTTQHSAGAGCIVGAIAGVIVCSPIVVGTAGVAGPALAPCGILGCAVGGAAGTVIHGIFECYPGSTMVTTRRGLMPISQVAIGDELLSFDFGASSYVWDEVYMIGHSIPDMAAAYVSLKTAHRNLSLSGDHFTHVIKRDDMTSCRVFEGANAQNLSFMGASWTVWKECLTMVRGRNVRVGDFLLTQAHDRVVLERVEEIQIEVKSGLYNPFTKSGVIVVDGVIGSVHSELHFEKYLAISEKVENYLPQLYQKLFLPVRMLYDFSPMCFYKISALYPQGLDSNEFVALGGLLRCIGGSLVRLSF